MQTTKDIFHKNSSLVRYYIKPYWKSILFASSMTILLGVVASIIGAMIGPSFKILTSTDKNQLFVFSTELGRYLGGVVEYYTGIAHLTAQQFLSIAPYMIVGLAFVKTSLFLMQWFIWEKVGESISKDIRQDLIDDYLHLNPMIKNSEEGKEKDALISSNITTDVKLFREYIVRFYGGVPREASQIIFMFITLFLLSSELFWIFFLGVIPSVVIVSRLGKKIRKRSNLALQDYSILTEWIQQRLLGIETIKHYKTEDVEVKKMQQLSYSMFQKFYKAESVKARTAPLMQFVALISVVIVLYYAFMQIASGAMSGSVVMSFLATLGLLTQSAGAVGRYYNSNRDGSVAVERIKTLLNFYRANDLQKVQIEQSGELPETIAIRCHKLSVSYGQNKNVLNDFSFDFEKGKIYCICGSSGAGKSTLLNLLLGLLKPKNGEVLVNRSIFDQINQGQLISYMPQSVLLMPATISQNIAYPVQLFSKDKILQSLEMVDLKNLVSQLPLQTDTVVGAGGHEMSGGQVQRILLARLWYHASPLIFIDEGTSALDPETESKIYEILQKLKALGCTIIMIAHRLSAVHVSDEVLLLSSGELQMSGNISFIKDHYSFKEVFALT